MTSGTAICRSASRAITACIARSFEHDRIGAREGNLRCVDTLPFICSHCGRREFHAAYFRERRHVKRFMAEYR